MTKFNWIRQNEKHITLEGTNYSLRNTIYNGVKVWDVYNFNTKIGMASTIPQGKKIIINSL